MQLRKRVPRPLVQAIYSALFPIPSRLARRHLDIHPSLVNGIRESIQTNYHQGWRAEAEYSPEGYAADLFDHLTGRLQSDRRMIIPWLNDAKPLDGASILEIGCGTGSSTVALAEQGASVVGIDPDCDALMVAKDRVNAYGVTAEFLPINSLDMTEALRGRTFDFVIFFASLEHMTIPERLAGLSDAWAMLESGGLLVIVETPNRLWYYDGHTSMLPFFHWLPDDLAFQYSRFSPRERFRELYREADPDAMLHFLRQGRGASFHEFDLALAKYRVVSSLSTFHGMRYKPQRGWFERRYKSVLRHIYPAIHEGFTEDTLFLILRKG